MGSLTERFAERMDQLYEYDREPVSEKELQPGRYFAGMYAGEHVAGTEFVIGAFFVLHGVAFKDLLIGLFVGNLLAVLSWLFITAPIATQTRLTLYWYLRKIAGPGMTWLYNIAVALLYCVLAGAMISVSTTAVGVGLGIETPQVVSLTSISVPAVIITLIIGACFTALAIAGFEKLSKFASVCSPWIFTAFFAGAIAVLPSLGVKPDFSNFVEIASTKIWNGVAEPGNDKFGMLHVMFFAWFANLAMHIGLSDLAILRYAKSWKAGAFSAFGMFPGHMFAWICSGAMVAAVGREVNPGQMAYTAAGLGGVIAVMLAGWTTANPTLYRAGLALQTITPNWPRWKVTLAVGTFTTLVAIFPIFMRLLDFVAIYGLILMPVGAIVVAEHWILPLLGREQFVAEKKGWFLNPNALLVWFGTLGIAYLLPIHLYFRWLPCYLIAIVAYTGLQMLVAPKVNLAVSEVKAK